MPLHERDEALMLLVCYSRFYIIRTVLTGFSLGLRHFAFFFPGLRSDITGLNNRVYVSELLFTNLKLLLLLLEHVSSADGFLRLLCIIC